ncbi:MAG: hypothetical protein KBD14_01705 [Candidatus Pacebacteria bacterium]|nr:hypothetical protein [Candidatus Paceibacterota bacterium]
MQKFNLKQKIGIATFIFLSVYSVFYYNLVSSSSNDNVSGYAWGADWVDANMNGSQNTPEEVEGGVGWISFNCLNEPGTCGIAENYGVNINPTTFDVTGYAWSNNFGWIKFGGLTGFPTGNATVSSNAKFVGTYNAGVFNGYLEGWARFCSPASNPDSCLGFLTSDKNGGWDGWISLKGKTTTNVDYGVTVTNNIFGNYAFGGSNGTNLLLGIPLNNNNVGWISFSGTNYDVRVTANSTVLDFYASPSPAFAPNFTTTLTWKSLNPNITFNSCVLSGGTTGTYNSPAIPNAKPNVAVATNPTSFTLTCTDSSSNQYVSTISVPRLQEEKLTLRNSTVQGGLTTLSWNASGLNNCNATSINPSSGVNWSGPKTSTPTPYSGSTSNVIVTAVLPAKTTYVLTCTGDYSGLPVSASLDLHTGSTSSSQTKVPVYKEN